jgi:hypothetical protein
LFSVPAVALALAIAAAPARAQTGAASMTGIITDQSGAAVPGATVTATNQATNVDYTAVTNEAGNYTITSVPIGTYIIKAELASFKTATTSDHGRSEAILRFDFARGRRDSNRTSRSLANRPCCRRNRPRSARHFPARRCRVPLNGRNTGQPRRCPARHTESEHVHGYPQHRIGDAACQRQS